MPRAFPNAWGYTFRKGQWVDVLRPSGDPWRCFRFVRLAPWNDFSRAYGRQALVLSELGDHEWTFGYDDLFPTRPHWPVCGQKGL